MHLLFNNDIQPQLSQREIIDFIVAPYVEDPTPEIFKDCPKFVGPIVLNVDWEYVPAGLTKKEYNKLLAQNKIDCNKKKLEIREGKDRMENVVYQEFQMESLIQIQNNIKKRLKTAGIKYSDNNLERAKAVPIESLIKVVNGFAKCPYHPERTGSMKIYPKENRFHCFSCGLGGDSVDVAMAINNINMSEAIKLLART